MNFDPVELLYRCKRIRMIEEAIADKYHEQQMRCPTHLSIGQELVGAAIGMLVQKKDLAVSTHRAHAHYLGKGGSLKALLAEIYGKESGCARGRGGSMHLIDRAVGFEGSTAIVGNSVPVGVGLGLSVQLDGDNERIVCVFIGDAVFETGVLFESMNFAATRGLPVLFICENNLYSVYSPLSVRQPSGRNFAEIASSFGLQAINVDGLDAIQTYKCLSDISEKVRITQKPGFIEIPTYRWREHCGPNFDNEIGYREIKEFEKWHSNDPIILLQDRLIFERLISDADVSIMENKIQLELKEAFEFAEKSEFPSSSCAYDFQYAQEPHEV